jgi:hypothetical protein
MSLYAGYFALSALVDPLGLFTPSSKDEKDLTPRWHHQLPQAPHLRELFAPHIDIDSAEFGMIHYGHEYDRIHRLYQAAWEEHFKDTPPSQVNADSIHAYRNDLARQPMFKQWEDQMYKPAVSYQEWRRAMTAETRKFYSDSLSKGISEDPDEVLKRIRAGYSDALRKRFDPSVSILERVGRTAKGVGRGITSVGRRIPLIGFLFAGVGVASDTAEGKSGLETGLNAISPVTTNDLKAIDEGLKSYQGSLREGVGGSRRRMADYYNSDPWLKQTMESLYDR